MSAIALSLGLMISCGDLCLYDLTFMPKDEPSYFPRVECNQEQLTALSLQMCGDRGCNFDNVRCYGGHAP